MLCLEAPLALFPGEVRHELPGWALFWPDVEFRAASQTALASLRATLGRVKAPAPHTVVVERPPCRRQDRAPHASFSDELAGGGGGVFEVEAHKSELRAVVGRREEVRAADAGVL